MTQPIIEQARDESRAVARVTRRRAISAMIAAGPNVSDEEYGRLMAAKRVGSQPADS